MITAQLYPVGTRYSNSTIYDEATNEFVHGFQVFEQRDADGNPTGRKTFMHNGLLWGISLAEKIRGEALSKTAPDMLAILLSIQEIKPNAEGKIEIGLEHLNQIAAAVLQAKGADSLPTALMQPTTPQRSPWDILEAIKKNSVMLDFLKHVITSAPEDNLVNSYRDMLAEYQEKGGFLQGIQLEELTQEILSEVIRCYGEDILAEQYKTYVESQKLPFISANDLLHHDTLTEKQRGWLSNFCIRWEAIIDRMPR